MYLHQKLVVHIYSEGISVQSLRKKKKYILFDSSDNFNITVEEHVKILKKMEKAESDEESLRDDDSELSFFTADF